MNFYKHHIGDYAAATEHLSWDEDQAYTRLLRIYYRDERALPANIKQVCRLVRAISLAQRSAVETVLNEFFVLGDDGWRNKRADAEILSAKQRAEINREVGMKGGRPPKAETQDKPTGFFVGSHEKPTTNPIQTPDSTSQTPEINPKTKNGGASPPNVEGLNVAAFDEWVQYHRTIGKPYKPPYLASLAKKLVAFGTPEQQQAAVTDSIANGYQGLFAPKAGTSERTRLLPPKTRYEAAQDKLRAYAAERGEVLGVDVPAVRPALGGQLRGSPVAALGASHRAPNGGAGAHDVRTPDQIRLGASADAARMHGDGEGTDRDAEHVFPAASGFVR